LGASPYIFLFKLAVVLVFSPTLARPRVIYRSGRPSTTAHVMQCIATTRIDVKPGHVDQFDDQCRVAASAIEPAPGALARSRKLIASG
jgi:hypothetical protein